MNHDHSTWETRRWRNNHVPANSASSRPPAPQLSAPTAVNPATQSSILEHYLSPHARAWIGKSRTTINEAATHQSRPSDERQTPATSGGFHHTSPHETSTASWRNLHHHDRHRSSSHTTDAPLTLDIPHATDLPRVPSTSNPLLFDTQPQSHPSSTPTTSLPPFASLKEHSAARNDGADGPDMFSMSSRLSCYQCMTLKPLLKDVTDAVAELDESVRVLCNQPNVAAGPPSDSPEQAVRWILEKLRTANHDIQDATRRASTGLSYQSSTTALERPSGLSPSNGLKRPAEQWDRDDLQGPKRPRSGNSSDQHWHFPPMGFPARDERPISIDVANKGSRLGYTPPPSDPFPGSAHPRHMSPTFTHRNTRALPSPSSLAYPPSAALSLPPPTAPSVGSPATSYQPTASIHTTSTNSVTSAHIADLQHQVTLKSLALQTLQSEYASLLQKLQRERVKSQTIEKKTSVADQEVNDLTGKNEELADQLKQLSGQLEECEKKRDAERAEAQREKDQWGRMLEMSGRLHAKVDLERQRLLQEKEMLERRLAHEGDGQFPKSAENDTRNATIEADANPHEYTSSRKALNYQNSSNGDGLAIAAAASHGDIGSGETVDLKREIAQLNARIDTLRSALLQTQQSTRAFEEQSRAFLGQTSLVIESALKNEDTASKANAENDRMPSGRSTPARQPPTCSPAVKQLPAVTQLLTPVRRTSNAKLPKPATLDVYHAGGKITTADMFVVARARSRSPDPTELGISTQPTNASPEELIRALGPVPNKAAPLPPFLFNPSTPPYP